MIIGKDTTVRRINTWIAVLAAVALLGGCASVGPDYKAPDIKAPSEWRNAENGGLTKKQQTPGNWLNGGRP
jgi:predicted small lipoprotein YifL